MSVEKQFDPLDELLDKAEWPQPTEESTKRLRMKWISLRGRSFWTMAPMKIAAAAAIVLLVAVGWKVDRRDQHAVQFARQTVDSTPPVLHVSNEAGRPPTKLELAMLRVLSKGTAASKETTTMTVVPKALNVAPAKVIVQGPEPQILAVRVVAADQMHQQQALQDLLAMGPQRAAAPVLQLLGDARTASAVGNGIVQFGDQWTETLFLALDDPRVAVRERAADLLARIDGPVVTARLTKMARQGRNQREAISALVKINSSDAKEFVTTAMNSPSIGGLVRSAVLQNQQARHQYGEYQ